MKKKYNFIRYIIFSFVLMFAFNFNSGVRADSCFYSIDYPFDSVTWGNDSIKMTYYDYLDYYFKRVMGKTDTESNEILTSHSKDFINNVIMFETYNTNIFYSWTTWSKVYMDGVASSFQKVNFAFDYGVEPSISFALTNSNVEISYIPYTNLTTDWSIERCPDVIAVKVAATNYVVGDWYIGIKSIVHFNNMSYYYLGNDNNIDQIITNYLNGDSNNFSRVLFFMNKDAKIASGGIMYVNRAYNQYFEDTKDESNIDPIVDKYLKIDGFKDGLTSINQYIDDYLSGTGNSDDKIADIVNNLIELIDIDELDTMSEDLKVLNNFNSTNVSDVVGLRNILNKFIFYYTTGLTSEGWFDTYMPDSQARYVDALIMVLEAANDNSFYLKREKEIANLNEELESKCGEEDLECRMDFCKKNSYMSTYAYCYNSESYIATEECVRSYKDNSSGNYDNFCERTDLTTLDDNFEKTQENLNKYIETSVYNSIKTEGVEIKDANEICNWLYSDDGLGVYIFGLLNVIRIGGPILIIILTAYDGIKMIASFKDDENKKFYNRLKIRLICLVILFLVPTLIKFLINLLFPEDMCLEYLDNI